MRSQRDRHQKLKKGSVSEKLGGKNYKDRHRTTRTFAQLRPHAAMPPSSNAILVSVVGVGLVGSELVDQLLAQPKGIFHHTVQLLSKFNPAAPPNGSVSPWCETSKEGTNLLLDKGIEYGLSIYLPQTLI